MRATTGLVCLGTVVLLAGCVARSLHPFCTEQNLVFESALIGTWEQDADMSGGLGTWTFEQSGPKVYRLTIAEGDDKGQFEAHLFMLSSRTYMDLFPDEQEPEWKDVHLLYALHVLPVHTVWRVWLEGDDLRLATLDPEWLKQQLEDASEPLSHELCEEEVLLTASTREVQQFLRSQADNSGAWGEPCALRRQK